MRRILILALLLVSCSGSGADNGAAAVSSPVDAEYRSDARALYEALLIESCTPARNSERIRLLAPERERVAAYERRASAGESGQLAIARSDALFALVEEGR